MDRVWTFQKCDGNLKKVKVLPPSHQSECQWLNYDVNILLGKNIPKD